MKIKFVLIVSFTVLSLSVLLNSCAKDAGSNAAASTTTGKGGSITRFTIAKNFLYVASSHYLTVYGLTNPARPVQVNKSELKFDIETIYPYNNYLFLGTRTGLYIYSIDTASAPRLIGEAKHARSCDPVVANDSIAFVTLKSSGGCGPAVAGLYVHDIKDITKPQLKISVPLPDPTGLGLQDSILYVCCGNAGLKIFNVKNPYSPVLVATKTDGNYQDVIPYNGLLISSTNAGIILYDITNPANPALIKKIFN